MARNTDAYDAKIQRTARAQRRRSLGGGIAMKYGKAFAAGVVGAIVMMIIMLMGRAMSMPANLEMILSTMMGSPPGAMAWVIGLIIHLIAGGVFALIYAAGFEYWIHRADWLIGLGFGVIHPLFSGIVVLGMLPAMHPPLGERVETETTCVGV
jgi:hypothetical protein